MPQSFFSSSTGNWNKASKTKMFGPKFKSSLLLVSLLALGQVSSQEEEEPQCSYVQWGYDAPECPEGNTEMYREEIYGQTSRFCCPTGSTKEKEQADRAYLCQTTKCQPATASNLCSSLYPRFVRQERLTYEETMRDTCTRDNARPGEEIGLTAMCCVHNSTSGFLLTTYGAERNEFPHMAALSVGCGGTIYNKRYIVTASHCIVGGKDQDYKVMDAKDLKVTLGTNIGGHGGDSQSKSNTYQAEKIIPHEGYSRLRGSKELRKTNPKIFNDIALVKLNRDIDFGSRVKALEIAPTGFKPLDYADNAVIAGWGTADNLQVTQALQKANFLIRPDDTCFKRNSGKWSGMDGMEGQLLCVGGIMLGNFSPTAGGGDSGGPAICRGQDGKIVHCGVTSYGGSDELCSAQANEGNCPPSVYAEVAYFNDWIKKHAGEQDPNTFYKPYLYGEMVAPKKYEHQVHITSSNGKPCGGTLISPDTVLTAAQCVSDPDTGRSLSGIKVTTGVRDLTSQLKAKTYGVKKAAVLEGFKRAGKKIDPKTNGQHDGYKRITISDSFYTNDLAVLRLDGKVRISERNLPELPSFESAQAIAANEVAFPRNTSRSGQLLQREFQLLGQSECQTRMDRMQRAGLKVKVEKNILCGVETYSGGSLCDRELGGGLFCKGEGKKDVLCGVQVFRLCEWSIPNGFMNMALYKGWVDAAMKQL